MSGKQFAKGVDRREFLRYLGIGGVAAAAGIPILSACTDGTTSTTLAGSTTTLVGGTTAPGGNGGAQTGTLQVVVFGTAGRAATADNLVNPFRQQFPDVEVQVTNILGTDWSDFYAKVLTQIAAGSPPDVVSIGSDGYQGFAARGALVPLDDLVTRDQEDIRGYFEDVHPTLIELMMREGHLYSLPNEWNTGFTNYNVDLAAQAGLEAPSRDWTKDDFTAFATALGEVTEFGYGFVVRTFGGFSSWAYANDSNLFQEEDWPGGEWLWDTFYSDNPDAAGRQGGWKWTTPTVNADANLEALEYLLELQAEGIVSATPGSPFDVLGPFTAGGVGIVDGFGGLSGYLTDSGMQPGAWDSNFFPAWKTQKMMLGAAGYGILTVSSNHDMAWELIKSITSEESSVLATEGNFTTPARKSLHTAERYESTGPQNWEVYWDSLAHPNTMGSFAPTYFVDFSNAYVRNIGAAFAGELTAQQALDTLQAEAEDLAEAEAAEFGG